MTYEHETMKAKTMMDVTSGPEHDYWLGYRIGLVDRRAGRDQRKDNAGWRDIDSPDALRAARCRGYRDAQNL